MKLCLSLSIVLALAYISPQYTYSYFNYNQDNNTNQSTTFNQEITIELLKMFKDGQSIRVELVTAYNADKPDEEKIESIRKRAIEIDEKNTKRLKEILSQCGWPRQNIEGKEVYQAVFMMVQHSDRNIEFQEYCLPLLKEAAEKGEAKLFHVALLTDRVLVNRGKPQIYGTQLMGGENGETIPRPLEDKARVNELRAKMGLNTLEEYIEDTKKSDAYFKQKAQEENKK